MKFIYQSSKRDLATYRHPAGTLNEGEHSSEVLEHLILDLPEVHRPKLAMLSIININILAELD